jgi:hypothetical protein
MSDLYERREFEVSHAGTFASEFAEHLHEIVEEQDTWAIQRVAASVDGAQIEREIIDWQAVLSAALEAVEAARDDPNGDEIVDLPDDPADLAVRSVNLVVDEPGTVVVGVAE